MKSIEVLMPDHEDIVLYSKRYGFWDVDELALDKDADTSDSAPTLSTDFHAMIDKIVASGEYVTLHNEANRERFIELSKAIAEEFEFDIVITKKARHIEASFTMPFGFSALHYNALFPLLKLAHEVYVAPVTDNSNLYTMHFHLHTEQYVKHTSALAYTNERSPAYQRIKDGLFEAIAHEAGYDHPEIKKRFKEALNEFNPSLKDSALDAIVNDMYSLTDFTSPATREKSLPEIIVSFYRAVYLHTGCYNGESVSGIRYKGLIPEPNALEAIAAARQELQVQKSIAYRHLDALVDAVIAFAITEDAQIEKILDELSEWCDDGDSHFLELDEKLCRHIYRYYPQLVKSKPLLKAQFLDLDDEAKAQEIAKSKIMRDKDALGDEQQIEHHR